MAFNQLSDAQAERLALLSEEMGEAQQAIGKILRHGYKSKHPSGGPTNKASLECELGDVAHAMALLCEAGDLREVAIATAVEVKRVEVKNYLHHQGGS